jgi:hypothetical protein
VTNRTAGTALFSGAITEGGLGIRLDNNDGSTVTFSGGLAANTGANPAFTAVDGGTVNVCTVNPCDGATTVVNTLATTTGTALNAANTTIGASGLTFRSISANGANNGIVLNGTGTSGGLTVTGNGGTCTFAVQTCTGGTIQNTSSVGVSLTNTSNVSFTLFRVLATGSDVSGTGVNTFSFTNSLNIDAGNEDNENAFFFGTLNSTNLSGTLTISNSVTREFVNDGLVVRNNTGALTINLTNNTFFDNDDEDDAAGPGFGVNAVLIEGSGTAGIVLNATGNTFDTIEGEAIQYEAEGSGVNDVNIIGNTMTNPAANSNFEVGGGITLIVDTSVAGAPATLTFDIQGNYFNLIPDDASVIVGEGNLQGRIGGDVAANQSGPGGANQGNTIKQLGSSNGCAGDGIRLDDDGNFNATRQPSGTSWKVLVLNNYIDQHNGVDVGGDLCAGTSGDQGIVIFNRDHTGTLEVAIENNIVIDSLNQGMRMFVADREGAVTNGPNTVVRIANNSFTNITGTEAISISSDDEADVCAHIMGNTKTGGGGPDGTIFLDRRVATAVFNVPQASTAAIAADNNGASVTLGLQPRTFGVTCNPTLPTHP